MRKLRLVNSIDVASSSINPGLPTLNNTAKIILSGLEEKDPYTYGHSMRVAELSLFIGKALNLCFAETQKLELVALLHDVGKIGIPDSILRKPDRLKSSEFEIMKSHPSRSVKILDSLSDHAHLIPGIKHHHERFDGKGYPDGLAGNDIPLEARIVLIADAYDAITSTRPYRLAADSNSAVQELLRFAGTQFDPQIVNAFVEAIHSSQTNEMTKKVKKIA